MDTIIRVNHSVSPVYVHLQNRTIEVLNKNLECSGPSKYDISLVKEQYYLTQESGGASGENIYKFLKDNDLIKDQLGIADLLAIAAKGIVFFRKYFDNKQAFGWKSVVRRIAAGGKDILDVPALVERSGVACVSWAPVDHHAVFGRHTPALRFVNE